MYYEWVRGPRTEPELAAQEALLPRESLAPFTGHEAALAAGLYKKVRRPDGRELDLAIAARAIAQDAALWSLNQDDFRDIAGLRLV